MMGNIQKFNGIPVDPISTCTHSLSSLNKRESSDSFRVAAAIELKKVVLKSALGCCDVRVSKCKL